MTGYASASSQALPQADSGPASKTAVTVEVRSVNGRFLDLSFRMPEELRGLEPALRELVAGQVKRGKVELRINTQRESDSAWPQPQPEQLNRLSQLESTVRGWLPEAKAL
jgi:uncharacterized protein (TIGR00255 family)